MREGDNLRKIIFLAIAVIVFCFSCYAEPIEIKETDDNGNQCIIKIFEVPVDTDPNSLVEADFKRGQYLYTETGITKEDVEGSSVRLEKQIVTVDTASNNLTEIKKKLEPQIEYAEDGYIGVLLLNEESISTKVNGYGSKSYNVTETKTYSGLDRNDPSYITKTIQKDGRNLNLSNVSWSVSGSEENPVYTATATYSGTGTSQYAKGYESTVEYVGEVRKPDITKAICTITYTGKRVFPIISALLILIGIGVISVIYLLFAFRKNVKIYNLQNEQYILIGKDKISIKHPVIDLNKEFKATSDKYAVVLSKGLTKNMFGKQVTVAYKDEKLYYMIEGYNTEFWFKVGDDHEE